MQAYLTKNMARSVGFLFVFVLVFKGTKTIIVFKEFTIVNYKTQSFFIFHCNDKYLKLIF